MSDLNQVVREANEPFNALLRAEAMIKEMHDEIERLHKTYSAEIERLREEIAWWKEEHGKLYKICADRGARLA